MKVKYAEDAPTEGVMADLDATNRGVSGQCLFDKDLDYDRATGRPTEAENMNLVTDTYAQEMAEDD